MGKVFVEGLNLELVGGIVVRLGWCDGFEESFVVVLDGVCIILECCYWS